MQKTLSVLSIALTLLFFTPHSAQAAGIAHDASTGTQTCGAAASTSFTFNLTIGGTNRYLVVSIAAFNGDTVSGVTAKVGGANTAMTQIAKGQGGATTNWTYFYGLANPDTGSNAIIVSYPSDTGGDHCANAGSYTGVHQTQAPDTNSIQETLQSGDRSISVTVTTANSWLLVDHMAVTAAPVSAVSCTLYAGTSVAFSDQICDSNAAVGSGPQTAGFHWNVADTHAIIGMALPPAAGAATSCFYCFWDY